MGKRKKKESWTLLKLLDKYEVVIPVIQRDYAHGRKGKEHIRNIILDDIYNKLEEVSFKERQKDSWEPLKMDFVYGEEKNGVLHPLDGQQRITTLWLIHWYLLFKKLTIEKTVGATYKKNYLKLNKLKYETRTSAEDFLAKMCSLDEMKALKKQLSSHKQGSIADLIKSQTWFYTEWLCDPTIEAMLRTISGDKDDREACIETIFSVDVETKYDEYWIMLDNNAVTFELQKLGTNKESPVSVEKELPESAADDIYIKMNARGKLLSNFENFKADLVAWINDEKNPDKSIYAAPKDDEVDKKPWRLYFSSQIDNDWTNVFWDKVKDGNKLFDPLFFSFINRFVLNEICLKDKDIPSNTYKTELTKVKDEYSERRADFDRISGARLKGKNADDSLITYEDFKYYKNYITFDVMKKIDTVLKTYSKCSDLVDSFWNNLKEKHSFIPRYDDDDNLVSTSLQERVLFFVTCKCLEYQIEDFDENTENGKKKIIIERNKEKVKRWLRVFYNLVRNYYYNDVSDMVNCLYLCESLTEEVKGEDIYKYLKDNDFEKIESVIKNTENTLSSAGIVDEADKSAETDQEDKVVISNDVDEFGIKLKTKKDRFLAQLLEEKQKAVAIMNDVVNEIDVIEAENYGKFSGTIRFLYRTGIEIDKVDWTGFPRKFANAKKWFPIHPSVESGDTPPDTELDSLQAFLHLFSGFSEIEVDDYLFPRLFYHNRDKNWKLDILCNDKFIDKVNDFISQDRDDSISWKEKITDAEFSQFVNCGSLLKRIFEDNEGNGKYYVQYFENGLGQINKKSASRRDFYVYIGSKQKKACKQLKSLASDPRIKLQDYYECDGYIWGRYIGFKFNEERYALYVDEDEDDKKKKIFCTPWKYDNPSVEMKKEWNIWLNDNALVPVPAN